MKTVLTSIALGLSLAASTAIAEVKEWHLNKQGVPIVAERTTNTKALAMFVCGEDPYMALADEKIPASAINKPMTFKARIDKLKIHDITSTVQNLFADVQGVYILVDQQSLFEMSAGSNIRFQFELDNGNTLVETYSLMGFTKAIATAYENCPAAQAEEEFFPDSEKDEDGDYF